VTGPLAGLVVVDGSSGVPGAYCTKLLADAGADVLRAGPARDAPLWRWLDRDKHAGGGSDLHGAALVVIDGDAARAPELAPTDATIVAITPYGRSGPWRDHPATDFTLQAHLGVIMARGRTDRPPVMAGGRVGEWAAGTFAAVGALTAVRRTRIDGRPHLVDVSTLECMALSMLVYPWILRPGISDPTLGVELPSVHAARDGWVGFCTMTPAQWVSFANMIGREDLGADPKLSTVPGRWARFGEIKALIDEWVAARTIDDVVEVAAAFRVPVTPIGNGETLPAQEPFASRHVFEARDGMITPRPPIRFSLLPGDAAPRASSPKGSDPERPLRGVRVVDFTAFWAGPFGTQYLATMGADVVKIESIRRPDFFRFVAAPMKEERWFDRAPLFLANNVGKRSVTLELGTRAGRDLAAQLVSGADVVVENFTPRVLDGFGLDHATMLARNPACVFVRMPAFGLDGPWRDRPGFAQTVEQASGMAWMTGAAEDPPTIPRGPGDPLAGMHAAFAVLCALEQRERTGAGGLVEVPLCDVAVNVTGEQVVEYSATGTLLTRDGNRAPWARYQDVHACAGSPPWVAISVETDEQLAALRAVAGDDVRAWTATRTADEVTKTLLGAGVPAAPVIDDCVLDGCEQLRARGFFESVPEPMGGASELPAWPMRVDGGPDVWYAEPAPKLGEDNDAVLGGDLGVSPDELDKLRADGVIGDAPIF